MVLACPMFLDYIVSVYTVQENSLCQPGSKRTPVMNQGRIKQRTEIDWLRLSYAVPKIQ